MSHATTTGMARNGNTPAGQPNPEVVAQSRRRTFSLDYRRRIVQEADGCHEAGQVGALLRREGLYSSHLTTWRRQRERGEWEGRRGRKADQDAQATEAARLRRENDRLRRQLSQAELIITAQKKLAQALEQTLTGLDESGSWPQ
jgi:transposase